MCPVTVHLVIFTAVTTLFHPNVPEMVRGILLWVHSTIRVKMVKVRSVKNNASATLCTRMAHMLGTYTRSIHDSLCCWIENQSDLNERLEYYSEEGYVAPISNTSTDCQ